MKTKLRQWLKRYLAAEVFGTTTFLIGSILAYLFCSNRVVAAYIATTSEMIGYYGVILYRDIQSSRRQGPYTFRKFLTDIKKISCEFGAAEYLDGAVLRPFFLFTLPVVCGNFALGTAVGKICADITFYVPAIVARELQGYLKRRRNLQAASSAHQSD